MNKIAIDGITKIYATSEGNKTALNNVSFQIDEGSVTVIGGENGSGKSVLMNIIAGLEKPTSGKIHSFAKAGLVFQEADTQILGETPREDISFGPKIKKNQKSRLNKLWKILLSRSALQKKQIILQDFCLAEKNAGLLLPACLQWSFLSLFLTSLMQTLIMVA